MTLDPNSYHSQLDMQCGVLADRFAPIDWLVPHLLAREQLV